MSKKEEFCNVRVMSGFFSHQCGRKAKGVSLKDGKPMCGIHLNAEKREIENENRFEKEWKERREFEEEMKVFMEKYGVEAQIRANQGGIFMSKESFIALVKEAKGIK